MLIDQQFINKVCQILTKRIVDFDSSNESQFLGLMLLKEILLIPLAEREPSKNLKHHFKKLGKNVKMLKNIPKELSSK